MSIFMAAIHPFLLCVLLIVWSHSCAMKILSEAWRFEMKLAWTGATKSTNKGLSLLTKTSFYATVHKLIGRTAWCIPDSQLSVSTQKELGSGMTRTSRQFGQGSASLNSITPDRNQPETHPLPRLHLEECSMNLVSQNILSQTLFIIQRNDRAVSHR